MKINWFFAIMIFYACGTNSSSAKVAEVPPANIIDSIIRSKYTAQNNLDGIEFATVDSLYIKSTTGFENFTRVTYFIHCSFQQSVRAPGSEAGIRPPIHHIDSIDIRKEGENWIMVTQ